MRFLIATQKAKRELIGPFEIMGSRKDLEHLVDILTTHLRDPGWCSGWTYIPEPVEEKRHPPNSKPISWEEEAKIVLSGP